MNKYYWIPAHAPAQVIDSDLSINELWHKLMKDPDHNLCFQSVCMNKSLKPYDNLIMLVDDCGKLFRHYVNHFASMFFFGADFGDYIAGDALVCKIITVPYEEDGEILFYEHDLGPLDDADLKYLQEKFDHFLKL